MAPGLPVCSGAEVKRALERNGFHLVRVSGSHHIMRRDGPPMMNVTVPVHGRKALKRATLAQILKQSGLSVETLIASL
ncbi:type II toxin-antitoxin system HicA family toxin [Jiella pelagia]|uniref:Type II toxin-antitoxin system HicA family toxin n=1 Tax=Jiella pelagia TaxID=2986949 RepID=A0ABY7CAI4_9HYPH|nr:type II toxin-antitoxin system HicA family toxin [Jiella pelagia]WAP70805.1 type II toxin-antitoxin system HicA family toxin [Jiella pelagia]